jgi:hypothetical protein
VTSDRRPDAGTTARHPGGRPRRNRQVRHLALSPGCRVVAHGQVGGLPHPPHLLQPHVLTLGHAGLVATRHAFDVTFSPGGGTLGSCQCGEARSLSHCSVARWMKLAYMKRRSTG